MALRFGNLFLIFQTKIEYAREKSDIISKKEGTYRERQKKQLLLQVEKKVKIEKKEQPKIMKNIVQPNNILFVEGLPKEVSKEDLA